jgi:hypothetical protein
VAGSAGQSLMRALCSTQRPSRVAAMLLLLL